MPTRYYALQVGSMIAAGTHAVEAHRKADIDHFANHSADNDGLLRVFRTMINTLFPVARSATDPTSADWDRESEKIRARTGSTPSSTPSSATTSSAAASAWLAIGFRWTPTSATWPIRT